MSWISRYLNIGVDPHDDYFDQRLKRAINILSLNAFVMITFAGFYGWIIQENNTSPFILFTLPVFILVVYFNAIGKSLTAISILFMSSAVLLVFFSLRTGEEAYTHIHFTLNIIGVALLYRKEKVRVFLYLNLIFTIIALVFLFISFDNGWFDFLIDPQVEPLSQRKLNAVFLLIGAFIFSLVVIKSHAEQNRILSSSLAQQKILLAEVNHRVKNNMAVIISLINMKKNGTTNHDTISTLTEIQDQVMSMALVHRKIYEEKNKDAVDLKSFIDELAAGIGNSFPRETKVSIVTKIQDVQIDVSKAIPFGLILNELITNSMKHAFAGIHNPLIEIDLKNDNFDSIIISFRDNGVGISPNKIDNEEKLGIMLIKSLVEQLDGQSSFKNESGFVFEMVIPR
jgi:two-component sensor histidine kinase